MLAKQAGIIIVDPIPLVRRKISSLLISMGLPKVTTVENPKDALDLLETKPCHLIFSDWSSDTPTGIDFLTKVRAHAFPRVRNICFVVLTADGSKASVEAAMRAGADDYILKPLTENHIKAQVTALLLKVSADQ